MSLPDHSVTEGRSMRRACSVLYKARLIPGRQVRHTAQQEGTTGSDTASASGRTPETRCRAAPQTAPRKLPLHRDVAAEAPHLPCLLIVCTIQQIGLIVPQQG